MLINLLIVARLWPSCSSLLACPLLSCGVFQGGRCNLLVRFDLPIGDLLVGVVKYSILCRKSGNSALDPPRVAKAT